MVLNERARPRVMCAKGVPDHVLEHLGKVVPTLDVQDAPDEFIVDDYDVAVIKEGANPAFNNWAASSAIPVIALSPDDSGTRWRPTSRTDGAHRASATIRSFQRRSAIDCEQR